MTKIKICGLSRECDIDYVNRLCPDYIGFIFAPRSRRYIEPERAAKLRGRLCGGISPVGVFVNDSAEHIAEAVSIGAADIVQLHGDEDDKYIARLRKLCGAPIIKAFRIDSRTDLELAERSAADYILLDNGSGGTGEAFDWSLIKNISRPYFLAGGLGISNVAEAVKRFRPYAVDVSSGVETDGYKDFDKISEFINAVRNS